MNKKSTIKPRDAQVGGSHYKDLPIQPRDYIIANKLGYDEGNIIKYVTRHKQKGGPLDIQKVIHYALMLLEQEYQIVGVVKYKEPKS